MTTCRPELPFSLAGRRVFVAGHRGLVGAALMRRLAGEGATLLTAPRGEVDLRDPRAVGGWMDAHAPEVVIVAAARVGGIAANSARPADFIYDNLMIEANLIHAAWERGVQKLLFLGSSCIYPRMAPQPLTEDALLTGPLEPTNEWYAVAKIAGIKLCQAYRRQHGVDFISAMPTNLYGPGDNYDPEGSHVIAGLLVRIARAAREGAPEVVVWGTGSPRREFLYVDDCADALVHLLKHYSDEAPINVGTGEDVTIAELATTLKEVVGFEGALSWDTSRPDGTPRKVMDTSRLRALGWAPTTPLREGLARTWAAYQAGEERA